MNANNQLLFTACATCGQRVTGDSIHTCSPQLKELTDEIEDLKNELMMEEESYMLLNESFLFAKESIKQQQIKIKELETKTLTDEEILEFRDKVPYTLGSDLIEFARAILKKEQKK